MMKVEGHEETGVRRAGRYRVVIVVSALAVVVVVARAMLHRDGIEQVHVPIPHIDSAEDGQSASGEVVASLSRQSLPPSPDGPDPQRGSSSPSQGKLVFLTELSTDEQRRAIVRESIIPLQDSLLRSVESRYWRLLTRLPSGLRDNPPPNISELAWKVALADVNKQILVYDHLRRYLESGNPFPKQDPAVPFKDYASCGSINYSAPSTRTWGGKRQVVRLRFALKKSDHPQLDRAHRDFKDASGQFEDSLLHIGIGGPSK